jgi:DNA-binding CsgD family transcriptional regulator/pimeloyl-ACP methyl ester carboxylesterase
MDAPPVQYVKTSDGFNLAYGISGAGKPLVFLPLTFSHVQLFWSGETSLLGWLRGLAARFRLIQYDGRGQGMSTRGLPANHDELALLLDLETLVDHLKLDRFSLMARGPLGHTALRYAASHPERVEALLLFSMPASGAAWPAAFAQRLAAEDWDLFLQSFSAFDGRDSDPSTSVPRLRQTITQADWAIMIRSWIDSDVQDLLSTIPTPALVLHPKGVIQPHVEDTMKIAAGLPNARMLVIDGSNQLGDPDQGLKAIDDFLADLPQSQPATAQVRKPLPSQLSAREVEVVRLVAVGRTNREIAENLVLSERTVQRHIANIYRKIGARNRVEATYFANNRL